MYCVGNHGLMWPITRGAQIPDTKSPWQLILHGGMYLWIPRKELASYHPSGTL